LQVLAHKRQPEVPASADRQKSSKLDQTWPFSLDYSSYSKIYLGSFGLRIVIEKEIEKVGLVPRNEANPRFATYCLVALEK
jgi:hypothetical protein